jgi:hypothetical protein
LDPNLERILSYPAVAAVMHQFCKEEMRVLNYYQRLQMYLKNGKKQNKTKYKCRDGDLDED